MNDPIRISTGLDTVLTQSRAIRASTVASHRINIERAIHLMHADLAAPLCLADLAYAARMSEFHFVRVFRELAGLPPLRFLSALRLAEARDLLVNTDEAVIQICLKVGYSSVGTFTRRFTELVGIPPLRLRQYARAKYAPALEGARLLAGADVRVYVTSFPETGPELASQALIAAFGSPLPFGFPAACAIAREGSSIFPSRLGLGSYYFLAFGLVGRTRTCASPVLVAINDLAIPQEAHITLRRVEPTDPPLLSFVPFILYKKYLEG